MTHATSDQQLALRDADLDELLYRLRQVSAQVNVTIEAIVALSTDPGAMVLARQSMDLLAGMWGEVPYAALALHAVDIRQRRQQNGTHTVSRS